MFGEKPIVGHTIIRINNNRIILPESTHVEVGEILNSTIDLYQRKIMIMNEQDFYIRLNELKEKIEKGRQERRIDYQTYHNLQRYIWGMLCLHDRKINKKKEFMLFSSKYEDQAEQRQIRKLNFKDEVFAVGVGTHLEIYPSEQAYYDDLLFQEKRKKV